MLRGTNWVTALASLADDGRHSAPRCGAVSKACTGHPAPRRLVCRMAADSDCTEEQTTDFTMSQLPDGRRCVVAEGRICEAASALLIRRQGAHHGG